MKTFINQISAVFLAFVILFTYVPMYAVAVDDSSKPNADSVSTKAYGSNVDLNSVDGVGNALLKAVDFDENDDSEYLISALSIENKTAYVKYSNAEDCMLVVSVYSENGQMLGSGSTFVEATSYESYVEIDINEMPDFFVLQAFLLDFDNSALCKSFVNIEYTSTFLEFKSKTAEDFVDDIVINFDDDGEDNFAVLVDEAVEIDSSSLANNLVSYDEKTGTYIFDNIDATLSAMNSGDIFTFQTGQEIFLIKIGSIEINGNTAVVAEDSEAGPTDYFKYIDIDISEDIDQQSASIDMSESDENVSLVGYEPWDTSEGDLETQSEIVDVDFSVPVDCPVIENKTSGYLIGNKNSDFSVKGGFKLKISSTFNLKCYYDLEWEWRLDFWNSIDQYFFFSTSIEVKVTGSVSIGAKVKHDFDVFTVNYLTPVGVVASAKISIHVEASAAVTLTLSEFKFTMGFKYDQDSGFESLCTTPYIDFIPDFTGDIEASFGVNIGPVISVLKAAEVELKFGAGLTAKAELFKIEILNKSDDVIHFCESKCFDGERFLYFECEISGAIFGESIGKVKLVPRLELKIGNFYFRPNPLKLTFKKCPNIGQKVTYTVVNSSNKPIKGVNVISGGPDMGDFYKNNKSNSTDKNGKAVFYYPVGEYTATFNFEGKKMASKSITMVGETKEITVKINTTATEHVHKAGDWQTVKKATCTQNGKKVKECIICGADVNKETISAKGHKTGDWQVTKKATCTTAGTKVKKCLTCGEKVKTETLAALGHTAGEWQVIEKETCTTAGIRIKKCTVCRNTILQENIAKKEHKEGEWETIKVPDCVYTGTRIKKCTVCKSVTKTEELPIKHSLPVWEFACDAETGESIGTANCSLCGEIIETQTGILTFTLSADGESYILSDCDESAEGEIVIPSHFNGKPVVSIGEGAFSDCYSLTNITTGNSVTNIGMGAFAHCESLASAVIPDSVTSLEDKIFLHCNSLTSITIPDSVTSIGRDAFWGCNSLTSITIPDSVTSIGDGAFEGCDSLASITIPNGVTRIGWMAFLGCDSLTNIIIPDSVTSIGSEAFWGCDGLTSITIPDSVTNIGNDVFYGCDSLTDVYYYGTEDRWNAITIGSGNEDLTYATIHYNFVPDDVASFDLLSTMAVDYDSDNVFTATANNAIIGNEYVLLVLKQSEGEIDLSAENLCYIAQKTATETAVSFDFIPKSDDFIMVVIVGDFGNGNETVVANEWKSEYTINWNVDGVVTSQVVSRGAEIIPLSDPQKTGCTFISWTPEVPDVMPAEDLTFTAVWSVNNYKVIWIVDGEKTETSVAYGEAITEPTPEKAGYKFVGWDKEIPDAMSAEDLTFIAVFEKSYTCPDCGKEILGEAAINEHIAVEARMKATVEIKNNSGSNTIKYGETLRLTAITTDMPADVIVCWYVNGEKKGEGETFELSFESGTKTVEVKLVDAKGNVLKNASGNEIKDTETVTVKAGFFQKLIAFFKKLFGISQTVVQSIYF